MILRLFLCVFQPGRGIVSKQDFFVAVEAVWDIIPPSLMILIKGAVSQSRRDLDKESGGEKATPLTASRLCTAFLQRW